MTRPVKLARTIRMDVSDTQIFALAAEEGELAVSGAFAFSDFTEADLTGKARQEFANGWLGLESFGRATLVAVCQVSAGELDHATVRLATHFVSHWGAPSIDAALPVAEDEIAYMRGLCDEHPPNTLLVVERTLAEDGLREAFRAIPVAEARITDVLGVEATAHAWEKMRGE